jgi:hypothetical protein
VTHKNSGNDRNEIEVSVEIPVPARFRACDRKEFLRNFEPRLQLLDTNYAYTYEILIPNVSIYIPNKASKNNCALFNQINACMRSKNMHHRWSFT